MKSLVIPFPCPSATCLRRRVVPDHLTLAQWLRLPPRNIDVLYMLHCHTGTLASAISHNWSEHHLTIRCAIWTALVPLLSISSTNDTTSITALVTLAPFYGVSALRRRSGWVLAGWYRQVGDSKNLWRDPGWQGLRRSWFVEAHWRCRWDATIEKDTAWGWNQSVMARATLLEKMKETSWMTSQIWDWYSPYTSTSDVTIV